MSTATENFIFTVLGRDETGGLIWHPEVLRQAEGHGLHLTVANTLIDEVAGDVLTDDVELVTPLADEHLDDLRSYSPEEMRDRVTTDADRQFVDDALLCTAAPGGRARVALVIGYGMTERRGHEPRLHDPHGFAVAVVRAAAGEGLLRHRHGESQVLIVRTGQWEVTLNEHEPRQVRLDVHDTLSVPPGAWRSIVNVSDEPDAEIIVINGGDGRTRLEWAGDVVAEAQTADVGIDANGYLAPMVADPTQHDPSLMRPNRVAELLAGTSVVAAGSPSARRRRRWGERRGRAGDRAPAQGSWSAPATR